MILKGLCCQGVYLALYSKNGVRYVSEAVRKIMGMTVIGGQGGIKPSVSVPVAVVIHKLISRGTMYMALFCQA